MAKTPAKTASKTTAAKAAVVAAAAGQDTSAAAIAADTVAAIVADTVSAVVAGDTVAGPKGADSVAGATEAFPVVAVHETAVGQMEVRSATVADGASAQGAADALARVIVASAPAETVASPTDDDSATFTTTDIPYSTTVELPADVARDLLATSERQGGGINISELASIVAFDPEAGIHLGGRELHVRSVAKEGRRRAGMAFTPAPVPLKVDDLTGDQLGLLLSDPELVVELD